MVKTSDKRATVSNVVQRELQEARPSSTFVAETIHAIITAINSYVMSGHVMQSGKPVGVADAIALQETSDLRGRKRWLLV